MPLPESRIDDLDFSGTDFAMNDAPELMTFPLHSAVETFNPTHGEIETESVPVVFRINDFSPPKFAPLTASAPKDVRLLSTTPWVRGLGKFDLSVTTEGWKFPAPPVELKPSKATEETEQKPAEPIKLDEPIDPKKLPIRARPTPA